MSDDRDHGDGGGGGGGFPSTRRSAVLWARSADASERERSLEALSAAYWKPVHRYVRARWGKSREDAQDLTQGFFLRAVEKEFFAAYDPAKGRFRTFLRACLDGYLANEHDAAHARKRGGGIPHVPLIAAGGGDDPDAPGGGIPEDALASPESQERYFEAEWVRGLFELAVERLRAECEEKGRGTAFRAFERYDLEDAGEGRLSYESLAAELGVSVTAVTNHLALARRELRRIVLETLREITASEEEFRLEARLVLGRDPD
jgi:RNA polymerase sigma factor (sigma-70 family)